MSSYWMTSKKEGTCKECGSDILIGSRVVYDGDCYKAYCGECGIDLIGLDTASSKEAVKEAIAYAQSRGKRRSKAKK